MFSMNTGSKWITQIALAALFMFAMAVPAAVASDEPKSMWLAEWIQPDFAERTVGFLAIHQGKLAFGDQNFQTVWAVDITSIRGVAAARGGKALAIQLASGEEVIVAVREPNLTAASQKKVAAAIQRVIRVSTATAFGQ
jgi:hypothetical protein